MVFYTDYSLGSIFIIAGIAAILFIIGLYIYFAFAWMKIAKTLKHKRPWLAFIPFANISMWLELGGFQWIWIFLIIGVLFARTILGILLLAPIMILLVISHWRAYEKLNYPGWLSLAIILELIYTGLGILAYAVIIGFVAWKKR